MDEVNTILQLLMDRPKYTWMRNPARICVLGPGGIGKTTLALSVIHHDWVEETFKEDRYFVSCEAATSPNLLLGEIATTLNIETDHKDDSAVLEHVILKLKERDCLLVLDNFETSWDPLENQAEVEALLTEFASVSRVNLIVTMRGSQQPAGTIWAKVLPPLKPIDMESTISIFETIAQKVDQFSIKLLEAVDCVPLAVTLIANMAAVDGESSEALWSRWEDERTSMFGHVGGQDRLKSVDYSVQLSLNSPRMQQDPGALLLLSAFSILPDGVSKETLLTLELGFPGVTSPKKAISTLRQNALVYEDATMTIRILSPIRHYMLFRYPPSDKSRKFVQDIFLNLALQGPSFNDLDIRLRLQKEVGNITAVLVNSLDRANYNEVLEVLTAIIHFCHYSYISGKGSTQAIARAIERLEALRKETAENSTTSTPKTEQSIQKSFRRVQLLQFKFGKSRPLATTPLGTKPGVDQALKLLADGIGCWGQLLSRQSQLALAEEKFQRAKELHIEAGDIIGHAYDLLNIGLALSRNNEGLDEALTAFEDAARLHEEINDKAGQAYDLMGAGHALRSSFRYEVAMAKFQDAASLFSKINDEPGQASALNGMGLIMQTLGRFAEAEVYLIDALKLCTNMGDVVGQAENLAGIAVTYLLRSRFSEAKTTIEKAISIRAPTIEADHIHILGRVYMAKTQWHQAKEILTHSLALHTDAGDKPGRASDFTYLSIISLNLGERWNSLDQSYSAYYACPKESRLVLADIYLLGAQLCLRDLQFWLTKTRLNDALEIFEELGCCLGKAQCLYQWAIFDLRCARYNDAMEKLSNALNIHTQVENVQGQADDLNKICEVFMTDPSRIDRIQEALKLASEALALHIEIGDEAGQGDDLYILATIFSVQGRLEDAEQTARKAVEMHELGSSIYGRARSLAALSDILWRIRQRTIHMKDGSDKRPPESGNVPTDGALDNENPLDVLTNAMKLFHQCEARGEFFECAQQKRRMKGIPELNPLQASLPDWRYVDDDEEAASSDDDVDDNEVGGDESTVFEDELPKTTSSVADEEALHSDGNSDDDEFHDVQEELSIG